MCRRSQGESSFHQEIKAHAQPLSVGIQIQPLHYGNYMRAPLIEKLPEKLRMYTPTKGEEKEERREQQQQQQQ